LNTWTQKYPQTDFADERMFYYLQAYSGANQPDKVLEYGAQLLGKDLNAIFKTQQGYILETLYRTAGALTSMKAPTAAQLEAGTKAANQLKPFIPTYFVPANKPPAAADKDSQAAKEQIEGIANQALLYAAVVPADQLVAKNDFKGAEAGYKTALQKFPENGPLAYTLSSTILKEKDPSKYSEALYFMARALAIDPAKGGYTGDARKQIEDYLKKQYTAVHGSDEGLADLMKSAAASAMPPAGFKIKTASEIALEKEAEFKEKYPELALWMSIKGALSAADGESYFKENMLGGVEIKNLKGQVMAAAPECNPKELKVGIPEPDQKSTLVAEITLKLENPVKGKPAIGQPIKFDAVPAAFAKEPFMLTMDVDADKVPELQVEACTPAKAPAGKKGAAPKSAAPAGKKAAPKK